MYGEPPHGTFMRLAVRNGARSPVHLATAMGVSMRSILAGHFRIEIEAWAGLPKDSLDQFSVQVNAKSRIVQFGQQKIALGDWSIRQRRVCPVCLADDRSRAYAQQLPADACMHHRAYWDVMTISNCPTHNVCLVSRCPKCSRHLSWSDPAVAKCGSGCDLATSSDPSSADPLSTYLASRLNFGPVRAQPLLDSLEYRHAVRFCEFVGLMKLRGRSERLHRRSPTEAMTARRSGYAQLDDFDRTFLANLDNILAMKPCSAKSSGMIASYGWVYTYWASQGGTVSEPIKRKLRTHAIRNGIIAPDEPVFGYDVRPTLNMKQLRSSIGGGFSSTKRKLIEANLVPKGMRRGVSSAIDFQAIDAIKNSDSNPLLGTRAIGERLGLGRQCVRDLMELKLLQSNVEGCTIEEIKTLEVRLSECANGGSHHQATPLKVAARNRHVRLARIIEAILEGRIRTWLLPERPDAPLATRLLVVPAEIFSVPKRSIPITIAAKMMKLHPEAVGQLVAKSYIKRLDARGVCPRSIAAFSRRFVPLAPLASALGTSSRDLARQLAKNNTHPAFEPPVWRQLIYERSKLVNLLS